MIRVAPWHFQAHDTSLDLTGSDRFLPMTHRTVLGRVIGGRVRIHGFSAPREATGGGCDRNLDLTWGRGRDCVVVGSVSRTLEILRGREVRSGRSINVILLG